MIDPRLEGDTETPAAMPKVLHEQLLHGRAYLVPKHAISVLTVDPEGRPHAAMVSGAALNTPGTMLSFPIRRNTRTWTNIVKDGKVTLLIGLPGIVAYVKGNAGVERVPGADSIYDACRLQIAKVELDDPPGVMVEGFVYRFIAQDPGEMEERRVFLSLCQEAEHGSESTGTYVPAGT